MEKPSALANPALSGVRKIVRPTTVFSPVRLCARLQIDCALASETLQHTGSFKFRAAYHLAATVPQQRIITASSGNFGQALAYACQLLSKRCTVVMPDTSARVKIDAVREFGGAVDLIDTARVSRRDRVAQLAAEDREAYVASAYDDLLVIAGNATLGEELAAHTRGMDAVLVPVGGGGLASGVIQGLRSAGASCAVIGAEPLLANDAARSLRAGRIVSNDTEPQTVADGARTVSLGQHNFPILQNGMSRIIEVPEALILEATRLLFTLANLKAEPTGALAVGALLVEPRAFSGKKVCCVISGGNVDPARFADLLVP